MSNLLEKHREVSGIQHTKLQHESTVREESTQMLLRSKLRAISRRMGYSDTAREKMELVCSELMSNQQKFSRNTGMMQLWEMHHPHPSIDIFALDFGPGIPDLVNAHEDGYTTVGTMGKGLGSIQRLADESSIYTVSEAVDPHRPWHGVAFWARFFLKKPKDKGKLQYGLMQRAYQDKPDNGDCIHVFDQEGDIQVLHMDGLGHGRAAAESVQGMEDLVQLEMPILERIDILNARLRERRGAVAIFADIDTREQEIRLAGVGDMQAWLICDGERQNIKFTPGILGYEHRSMEVMKIPFPLQAMFLTASDGIRSKWQLDDFPGLWRLHPQLIAMFLSYVMGRSSDDKSIMVARATSGNSA